MLFVCKGFILVGYRMFNETFYAKILKQRTQIGGYYCLYNKVSEFLYKAADKIQGFSIKKENFVQCMQSKLGKNLIPKI